ncbi:hypothetical protein P171DRAFT_236796 [Karstenula rhodostoma CBS 690.94]|uniref:Uncharacterized protein n=1 Tax=Karstenula rhodostoma CBS 690.94 TaxID=1392251 RepID=A0A9P4PS89_9PLEO|nr:hypothetical protein P171DRAFT_236796 [Karstenula rhodostoma CBS 690.94]
MIAKRKCPSHVSGQARRLLLRSTGAHVTCQSCRVLAAALCSGLCGPPHSRYGTSFTVWGARLLRVALCSPTVAEVLTGRERGRW